MITQKNVFQYFIQFIKRLRVYKSLLNYNI